MSTREPLSVLIIDDDPGCAAAFAEYLLRAGLVVRTTLADALPYEGEVEYGLVVLNPYLCGLEIQAAVRATRRRFPGTPLIVRAAAYSLEEHSARRILACGADVILSEKGEESNLLTAIASAMSGRKWIDPFAVRASRQALLAVI